MTKLSTQSNNTLTSHKQQLEAKPTQSATIGEDDWLGTLDPLEITSVHDTYQINAKSIRREMFDPPENPPLSPLTLDYVGITGQQLYLNLRDGESRLSVYGTIAAGINLPALFRGIHMSRIASQIDTLSTRVWLHPLDFVTALGRSIESVQRGTNPRITLELIIPIKTILVESGNIYRQNFRFTFSQQVNLYSMTVCIPHITACPCVQSYAKTAAEHSDDNVMRNITHSQRSLTKLTIKSIDPENLKAFNLLKPCFHTLIVVSDMLKREDEFNVVYRAHERPQFIEDCVRELAMEVQKAPHYEQLTQVIIESTSCESIHSRDISAKISLFPGENGNR